MVIYVGMQAKPGTTGSYSDFMAGVSNGMGSSGQLSTASPGVRGGETKCGTISNGSLCLWIAGRSAGMLVAPEGEFSASQLAAIMRAARVGLETTGRTQS